MTLQRYGGGEARIVPIVPIDTKRAVKLRFTEILHYKAHGLPGEVFGMAALVAPLQGLRQSLAATYPAVEMIASHMRCTVGEIHPGESAFGITLDKHILRCV